MQTQDFRTRTIYKEKENTTVEGFWPMGLDIGYSSVKAFSPNSISCFPSFARRRTERLENFGRPRFSDIFYQDEKGVLWDVGEIANNSLNANDVDDSVNTLYTRYHYESPMYLVLARVGMAMASRENSIRNRRPQEKYILQTGLPAAYEDTDTKILRDVLSGDHKFSVKFGAGPWLDFNITLQPDDVRIISQPMGAFFGACLDDNAHLTKEGQDIFMSQVAMLDGGFGTMDLCVLSSQTHKILRRETYPKLGMMEVFQRTIKEIARIHGTEIAVHTLQPCLKKGTIEVTNRQERSRSHVPFEEILLRHNNEICQEALDKMEIALDSLAGIDYLLLSGGTCASWKEAIKKRYEKMEGLKIIGGENLGDLPEIFSIARGYFLRCVQRCEKRQRENA